MQKPQRGEIWRFKLSDSRTNREAIGSEIGAKRNEKGVSKPERPCLIISANVYNQIGEGITIVPLTTYSEGKEDTLSLWAVTVRPTYEIILDPTVARYPSYEQLHKSIIDCAQLMTVFAVEPSKQQSDPLLPNDLFWNRRYGKLSDMTSVESALQAVVGGGIRKKPGGLRFKEGDILRLDLPGRPNQRCLVVSSAAVDYRRENEIFLKRHDRPLGHITVIPLESASQYVEFQNIATIVEIHPIEGDLDSDMALAIPQEIYTIDWRLRNTIGPIGRVSNISDVQSALRDYLDLP